MSIEDEKVALYAIAQELDDGPRAMLSGPIPDDFENAIGRIHATFGTLTPAAEEAVQVVQNARSETESARNLTAGAAETLREIAERLGM